MRQWFVPAFALNAFEHNRKILMFRCEKLNEMLRFCPTKLTPNSNSAA
jgi:hypothetical protein